MADTSPLAGLLDRAGPVFLLAWQLGRAFQEERGTQGAFGQSDSKDWDRHQPVYDEFCAAVLDLRDVMQKPPEGFVPVAQALLKAAAVAKQIRDAMQMADGRTCAAYLDFFPELNSVAESGREAIKEVTKARCLDDSFAFVDQLAARKDAGIDTTPTMPKPPQALIESAARGIPDILANVQPKYDKAIELVASNLAKRLQDAKHTRAAAQWAIHEAVQAGQLQTALVETIVPNVFKPGSGDAVGFPGARAVNTVSKGKPASFDSFKVVATESLWTWWRSLDMAHTSADPLATYPTGKVPGVMSLNVLKARMNHSDVQLRRSVEAWPEVPMLRLTCAERFPGRPFNEDTIELLIAFLQTRGLSPEQARHLPLAEAVRLLAEEPHGGAGKQGTAALAVTRAEPASKRGTKKGDAEEKLISALTKHHRYADNGCLNLEPIGNNKLAEAAGVSVSTASAFFTDKFQGHTKYKVLCRDSGGLVAALKLLNNEFAPHNLYGRRPVNEDDRDDDT